jgi:fatty-acyl-CoA synthase
LYAQSLRTARALRARFEPGERVAIWAHNIPEWIHISPQYVVLGAIQIRR